LIEELTQDNFLEKITNNSLSVIDFYAEWCLPCRSISKTLEKLSSEYDGRVNFFKVSVTKNATLAADLKISEFPTIIFYKDPENIDIQHGTAKEEKIKEKIDALKDGGESKTHLKSTPKIHPPSF
jgi:thioredoxin 1